MHFITTANICFYLQMGVLYWFMHTVKLGKGTYKWKKTGALYDGDWKEDMRNGFGTYSIPTEDGGYTKQYSGGWKDNKKHVCVL